MSDTPIRPCTGAFADHRLLMLFCQCWEQARSDRMIPTKRDFEKVMLDYPEILPNMSIVELVSPDEYRYLYLGSERVFQENRDRTDENTKRAFAPNASQFLIDWTGALLERPSLAFWKARMHLPSGTRTELTNLSAVLSGSDGEPTYVVLVTEFDKALARELQRGGYLIGSHGIDVVPVDIGCGVPCLPRTVE